jgi:hypothetical protein
MSFLRLNNPWGGGGAGFLFGGVVGITCERGCMQHHFFCYTRGGVSFAGLHMHYFLLRRGAEGGKARRRVSRTEYIRALFYDSLLYFLKRPLGAMVAR